MTEDRDKNEAKQVSPAVPNGRAKWGGWAVSLVVLLIGLLIFGWLLRVGRGVEKKAPARVAADPFWVAMNRAASSAPAGPAPAAVVDEAWRLRKVVAILLFLGFAAAYAKTLHSWAREPDSGQEAGSGCGWLLTTVVAWCLYVWSAEYHRLTPGRLQVWWFGAFAFVGFPLVWAKLAAWFVRARFVRTVRRLAGTDEAVAARVAAVPVGERSSGRLASLAVADGAPPALRGALRKARACNAWLLVLPSVLVMWVALDSVELHLKRLARWDGSDAGYYLRLAGRYPDRPAVAFRALLAAAQKGERLAVGDWLAVAVHGLDHGEPVLALAAFCKVAEVDDSPLVRAAACAALLEQPRSWSEDRRLALDVLATAASSPALAQWSADKPVGRMKAVFNAVLAARHAAAADRVVDAVAKAWPKACEGPPARRREFMGAAISFARTARDLFTSPLQARELEENWAADYVVRHRDEPEGYFALADAVRRRQPAGADLEKRIVNLVRVAHGLNPNVRVPDELAKVLVLRGNYEEILWMVRSEAAPAGGGFLAWVGRHFWQIVIAAVVALCLWGWLRGRCRAKPTAPSAAEPPGAREVAREDS